MFQVLVVTVFIAGIFSNQVFAGNQNATNATHHASGYFRPLNGKIYFVSQPYVIQPGTPVEFESANEQRMACISYFQNNCKKQSITFATDTAGGQVTLTHAKIKSAADEKIDALVRFVSGSRANVD